LIPVGWLIFNTDFTDLLADLRLPYVYAFPFTGFALMVIGAPMAMITIWDSLASLVPDGFYRRAHGAWEEWKNLGTPARFLVISTVGELAILGIGWSIGVALGMDYHATIAIILAVVLLFGAGLFQGRTRRYYPRGQRYDRYLQRQAGKMSKPKGGWLVPATYILWITLTLAVILFG
jgi:hypothetical protein